MDLHRLPSSTLGTFGMLVDDGLRLLTLEPPWLNNARSISCIPPGRYVCRPFASAKHGHTFQVCGVPGRDAILFHAGNTLAETEGCVLLGRKVYRSGILESRAAMDEFMRAMAGRPSLDLVIS